MAFCRWSWQWITHHQHWITPKKFQVVDIVRIGNGLTVRCITNIFTDANHTTKMGCVLKVDQLNFFESWFFNIFSPLGLFKLFPLPTFLYFFTLFTQQTHTHSIFLLNLTTAPSVHHFYHTYWNHEPLFPFLILLVIFL